MEQHVPVVLPEFDHIGLRIVLLEVLLNVC